MLVPVIALLLVLVMPCVHLASIALDSGRLLSRSRQANGYGVVAQADE
jgi:hypothetical protein